MRECEFCDKPLAPERWNSEYCSEECKKAHEKEMGHNNKWALVTVITMGILWVIAMALIYIFRDQLKR